MLHFIENDPAQLAHYVSSLERGLVVFDGRPGAGKTHLGREMERRIRCKSIDADCCFLVPDQKKFVGALILEPMLHCIEAHLARTPLVVLSTVCAREVAEKAKLAVRAFIWVERTSLACLQVDRRDFADDHNADEPFSELHREVEAYVKAYNARQRPDAVYLNAHD